MLLNKDHKWRVCPSLASATAVAVGREQKMLENDVPAVAQNLQHCFAGSLPELSVDEYFLILDEALGLGCLFKKKKKLGLLWVYICPGQCCRSTGDPGRGTVWDNRILKTLFHPEGGGPGGTPFSRTKAPRFQPMCLLLENVTQVNEQNQVQLMISLSLWLCFCAGTNLFTASAVSMVSNIYPFIKQIWGKAYKCLPLLFCGAGSLTY